MKKSGAPIGDTIVIEPARAARRLRAVGILPQAEVTELSVAHRPVRKGRVRYRLEHRQLRDMGDVRSAWVALAARAVEPNPFFEPAFTEAACLHLPQERAVSFVLVWAEPARMPGGRRSDDHPDAPRLAGLFPVTWKRRALLPEAHGWKPLYGALGTPLVDIDHVEEVLEAYFDWLGSGRSRCTTALFPQIGQSGPFASALLRVLERTGRSFNLLVPTCGGTLPLTTSPVPGQPAQAGAAADALVVCHAGLAARGTIQVEEADGPAALRDAAEAFLVLEAAQTPPDPHGFGLGSGTDRPLLAEPACATFLRAMLRKFAQTDRIRIHVLRVGGVPAAALITIRAGGSLFLWRSAQAPDLAAYSPAALLATAVAQAGKSGGADQAGPLTAIIADTGALHRDPLIAQAWCHAYDIADWMVSVQQRRNAVAMAAMASASTRHRIQTFAGTTLRLIQGGRA